MSNLTSAARGSDRVWTLAAAEALCDKLPICSRVSEPS